MATQYIVETEAGRVQVFAQNIQFLIGGIIVTEYLFSYPGLGKELVDAVYIRDVREVQSGFECGIGLEGGDQARRSMCGFVGIFDSNERRPVDGAAVTSAGHRRRESDDDAPGGRRA